MSFIVVLVVLLLVLFSLSVRVLNEYERGLGGYTYLDFAK